MFAELSKEFDKITNEAGKESESMRVMFIEALQEAKVEHNELREELEKIPHVFNTPPMRIEMDFVEVLEKKLKENEDLKEEYQLKMKEWEEIHGQKVGELE